MAGVIFIDTSVLLQVLMVPGNFSSEQAHRDRERFDELNRNGWQLVLPLTTVIETGNAIAKVAGGHRHRCIDQFLLFLRATLDEQAPWVAAGFTSSAALLARVLDGGPSPLRDLMSAGVGTGDAAIIAEVEDLRSRIPRATPVDIWTHDRGLAAYALPDESKRGRPRRA